MIRRAPFLVLGIIALACAAAAAAPQLPPRDNAAAVTGTASIAGRVFVDGPSRQPARRVRVTLTNVARTSPGQTTTTGDDGAFIFRDLPAGRFEIQTFKNGYLRSSYGASRPERAGTPVVVKDGEAVANLAVTIARGGAISGVVRDVRGRPVPGVSVKVLKQGYNAITGERTLGAPSIGSAGTTDDRGEYRAYGLPPGGYLVLVTPGPPGSGRAGGSGVDDIRPLTAAEVQQALQAARAGSSSASAARPPPSLSTAAARVNYAPVFHPGVTDVGAAATVTLGLSEERVGVDIAIQFVPTAVVSGVVTPPPGVARPASVRVTLVPAGPQTEMLAGAGLRGPSTQTGPDGTYTFAGVAPGAYTVKAGTGTGGRGVAAPVTPALWATADVVVNGRDLDVPLTLQPGLTINGHVVFEGSRPTPAELQTLSFMLVPPGSGGMIQTYGGGGHVDAEGHFTFSNLTPDAYQFVTQWANPSASGTWSIKSSTANGREAFEAPLRVNANEPLDWTVTFTDRPTNLVGTFQDRGGRAATDYFIIVFPADRQRWTPGSRRVRTMRPATDGTFGGKGLPPGEYFLAAVTDLEPGEWNDPAFLDQLVRFAVTVTLREGETTTQDLRIGGTSGAGSLPASGRADSGEVHEDRVVQGPGTGAVVLRPEQLRDRRAVVRL
jgi:hypothetical protein